MAVALQATAATSFVFMRGISLPMVPLKLRGNACFASNNSSSIPSAQPPSIPNNNTHHQDHIVRPWGNYSSHIWGDFFLTLPFTKSEFESCSIRVEDLKKKVKDMLMSSTDDPIENILLIHSLCRLGVSYHFETEIEEQLSHLFTILPQLMDNKDYDLHIVAVIFQCLRSNGYKMSCDVFNKFKNGDKGMFKEELASNIKGIISLYEASNWATHGEDILDEALEFTTLHLKSFVASKSCPDYLKEYITNALEFSYHKGIQRMEARQYVSFYGKEESHNDLLLQFAKYDFNLVQMLYRQELSLLYGWWKKSNLTSRFPHVRQRLVEAFFIGVGQLFEPCFALARKTMTKGLVALTLVDDTYDAYGLYDELQYFTKAFERFEKRDMDELPGDYLKSLYEAVLKIFDELEYELSKEGRSFSISYYKAEVTKLVQSYLVQTRWAHEHIVPTVDEYLENRLISAGITATLALLMMGMEEADEEAHKWLLNCDAKILTAMSLITSLYNDFRSNEAEEKRGNFSGITCYMKEYGISRKEAIEGYRERIKVAWKDLNEGFMVRPTNIPWPIYMAAFNFGRVSMLCYKEDDGYTNPEISYKDYITKVLIDPISLQE